MSNLLRRAQTLLFACAMGLAAPAWAAATISTIGDWDGAESVQPFGIEDTATYGQVVTAPPGETSLSSFAFQMKVPTTVAFRGQVFAWDAANSRATGASLYESPMMSTTQGAAFEAVTFTIPGGVPVTSGQQYVVFATTSQDQAGHSGTGEWGYLNSSTYSGGGFVYQNNGANAGTWTTSAWDVRSAAGLAFTAVFGQALAPVVVNPVPTLSEWSLALMALALGGVAVVTLRRRS